jgi:bifunctional non-homologous end joining protein LigD
MASLQTYRRKRDFKATAEPRGAVAPARGSLYVIQKHAARRLHYDLRLELDGVLKSWAVTRGPSLVPGEKRLAVEVEDHPLDYAGFEGDIPKGQYGGGSVIVWDRGAWQPIGDARKGLAKGHLEFSVEGEKLAGRWHLVRIAGRRGETRVNWLLIKGEDAAARGPGDPDILEERPESVLSGRRLAIDSAPASARPARATPTPKAPKAASSRAAPARATPPKAGRAKTSRAKSAPAMAALPDFVPPMLATLRPAPPRAKGFVHEIKFDGYRLQARIAGGKVALITRSGLDWTARFGPALTAALKALPLDQAILDCELVAENDAGASDFAALQAALSAGTVDDLILYGFDLLHLDGEDLRPLPLLARKERLRALLPADDERLRYSEHFEHGGDAVLRHSCRLSLEGIISKRADAPYVSGRTEHWIKSKCSSRQELVIGGYAPNAAAPDQIGALVLGVNEGGKLRHAGRVGTGWSAALARDLMRRLQPLAAERSPFAGRLSGLQRRDVVFVRPELVAEVEFRGWTTDAQLRQASFRGLREDKPAAEVVREEPAPAAEEGAPPQRTLRLTNPDRVLWPDVGVTKAMLADYYATIWRTIAPFVAGRPLSLLRCPNGIEGERFFQKHPGQGRNPRLLPLRDPQASGEAALIAIQDLDGLLSLVQSAALEIHPWGATAADLDRPDMLTMDLDPGEGVSFDAVRAAALDVRERLQAAGFAAFLKTSGGKGLHVVAPLTPKADWPTLKAFAKGMAESMARDAPDRYVAVVTRAKRGGRILVDYLRNQRGATAVAAYSTRARPGAPVSMPLAWDELAALESSAAFTLANTPERLEARGHAWHDFRRAARPLDAAKGRR